MRKFVTLLFCSILSAVAYGQEPTSRPFCAYLYNNEYEVYLNINFYEQNVTVPDQELYGQLPGYLGKKNNPFCWVITSATLKGAARAELSLINDYGSEDLKAELTCLNDSTYELRQLSGSALKVPKKGKWMKLPRRLPLKRRP